MPEGIFPLTGKSLLALERHGGLPEAHPCAQAADVAVPLRHGVENVHHGPVHEAEVAGIGGQPDYALGSVHAVTADGTLVIASASGSQLASYAWGAANVIFVVGAQKLVPSLEAARERIVEHSLKLEDARAYAAYGQNSYIGKVLEIHQEQPGRIHVVLIRQSIGF